MEIPAKTTIYNKLKGIISTQTKKQFSESSLIAGLTQGFAMLIKNLYDYSYSKTRLRFYLEEMTLEELEEFGNNANISLIPAQQSKGFVNIKGDIGAVIGTDVEFLANNQIYNLLEEKTLIANSFNISVVRNGTVAIAKATTILNFASGLKVNISGFTGTNFNKNDIEVVVLNDYQFQYEVEDTGEGSDVDGSVAFNGVIAEVRSQDTGVATQLANGQELTNDINVECFVAFNGISGGTETETRDSFLTRLKDYTNNNRNSTTNSKIINTIKAQFPQITTGKVVYDFEYNVQVNSILKIPSAFDKLREITTDEPHRMKVGEVYELTGSSQQALNITSANTSNRFVGEVVDSFKLVIFVNDENAEDSTSENMKITPYKKGICTLAFYKQNQINKTLSQEEITAIEEFLEDNASAVAFYKVVSAESVLKTINISNVVPDLQSVKDAIKKNLEDYFVDSVEIGLPLLKSQVDSIIFNTRDVNGTKVREFETDMLADFQVSQIEILDITVSV